MSSFKFNLEQRVSLKESGETGTIIGRAEYTECRSGYLIRYKNARGVQTENWWSETAIEEAPAQTPG